VLRSGGRVRHCCPLYWNSSLSEEACAFHTLCFSAECVAQSGVSENFCFIRWFFIVEFLITSFSMVNIILLQDGYFTTEESKAERCEIHQQSTLWNGHVSKMNHFKAVMKLSPLDASRFHMTILSIKASFFLKKKGLEIRLWINQLLWRFSFFNYLTFFQFIICLFRLKCNDLALNFAILELWSLFSLVQRVA
jgi:hypothetical protein